MSFPAVGRMMPFRTSWGSTAHDAAPLFGRPTAAWANAPRHGQKAPIRPREQAPRTETRQSSYDTPRNVRRPYAMPFRSFAIDDTMKPRAYPTTTRTNTALSFKLLLQKCSQRRYVRFNGVPRPQRINDAVIMGDNVAKASDGMPRNRTRRNDVFVRQSASELPYLEQWHEQHVEIGRISYETFFVYPELSNATFDSLAVFQKA